MTKPRNKQITINIEKELADLVYREAFSIQSSGSSYIRNLIIADLKLKGHLTDSLVEALL